MIYGVGTDIVRIDRIAGIMMRTRGRFAEKVLGAGELDKYRARAARSSARGLAFLAMRFAAKEACAKAIGLGKRWPITWRAVQTLDYASGQPRIVTAGPLADWLEAQGIHLHVSLSDEAGLALAFIVAEQRAPNGGVNKPDK
jgi:holo-[acyl-carrier protein] synthase